MISSSAHSTEQKTEAQGDKGPLLNVLQPAPEPGYGPAPSDPFAVQHTPPHHQIFAQLSPRYVPRPLWVLHFQH